MKELLEDKNRLKIDVRIVYGKSELQPEEINWLKELDYIRTSFCKNLHAKCYMNEEKCIITSLNLYEFSQINNNEMSILVLRDEDAEVYKDAYEEAQRIIRISEEVRIRLERVENTTFEKTEITDNSSKLTSSKLATKLGIKTTDLLDKLTELGYLEIKEEKHYLTAKAKEIGGEFKKGQYGTFFIWNADVNL